MLQKIYFLVHALQALFHGVPGSLVREGDVQFMKVKQITGLLDRMFPLSLQEDYDNAGMQVCFPDREVSGILLALDIGLPTVDEAAGLNCQLIVTHHPLLFKPVRKIIAGELKSDIIISLMEHRISLYSAHTNLDKACYRTLGEALGLPTGEVLIETGPTGENQVSGFGMLSVLPQPLPLATILSLVRERLKLEFITYTGDDGMSVRKVALMNGAGGSSIEKIIRSHRPDCIITGDVGYHHMQAAREAGIAVIDAGHYGTETVLVDHLHTELDRSIAESGHGSGITLYRSSIESSPFRVFR